MERLHRVCRFLFLGGLSLLLLGNCVSSSKNAALQRRARAFIVHWPVPEGNKSLRLAVKDLIDMKGVVTTAGSEYIAKHAPPAAKDAKCLEIARKRDVKIVGKTNLTELAVTTSGVNSFFGTPRNRFRDLSGLIPGGSSSGSAIAVKNDMADVALGTDTAGSIRVPAACCGIFGLKTTFGLISIDGVFPISPEYLDTVGPMAKDINHLVQGMDLLQEGFAEKYHEAVAAKPSPHNIKIGRLYLSGTDSAIDKAIDGALLAKGFRVIPLSKEFKEKWEQAQKDGRVVAASAAWLHDQQYGDKKGISVLTKAVFLLGKLDYETRYQEALSRRAEWQRTLRDTLREVDFIALPTLQKLPPKLPFFGVSVLFELRVFEMQNTVAVNFAGNPALAVPIEMPQKHHAVPVTSVQLIGKPKSEAELLNAGRLLESKH